MRKGNALTLFIGVGCLLFVTCVTATHFSVFLVMLSVWLLLMIVKMLPICRGYESLWLFVLTMIGSIPINVKLIINLLESWLYLGNWMIGTILSVMEVYMCVLAVEEIVIGILGRLIWRRQRSLIID